MLDKKPALVLSDEGIYDNTGAFSFGLIPWTDIADVYERSVRASMASKQYFVTIRLVNPDKYISRETNSIKRKLLQANATNYGSPVNISTNGLKTNHQELLRLTRQYFETYKSAT